MAFCSKCGAKNEENALFCQNCGIRIKDEEKANGISKYINLKVILIGGITYITLIVIWYVLQFSITGSTDIPPLSGYVLLFIIVGIISGYLTGDNYVKGGINACIVGLIFGLFWIRQGLDAVITAIFVFVVFAFIGSVIGVFLHKKNILKFLRN